MEPRADGGEPLTPRQYEVLELATMGLSVAQIANELYLSRSAVKNHFYEIRRRLRMTTIQAVLWFDRQGRWRPQE